MVRPLKTDDVDREDLRQRGFGLRHAWSRQPSKYAPTVQETKLLLSQLLQVRFYGWLLSSPAALWVWAIAIFGKELWGAVSILEESSIQAMVNVCDVFLYVDFILRVFRSIGQHSLKGTL